MTITQSRKTLKKRGVQNRLALGTGRSWSSSSGGRFRTAFFFFCGTYFFFFLGGPLFGTPFREFFWYGMVDSQTDPDAVERTLDVGRREKRGPIQGRRARDL